MFKEYRDYDASGLAELVARGDVSAAELLAAAQARAAEVNPKVNAVVIGMDAIAAERVKTPLQGAFAGVPFLIKDIVQDYAGVPSTSGSRALRDWKPDSHAAVVQRFLDAGLVIFGKTNTPELALKGITEPQRYGATRNPWNLDHTPGGSSGGAAAAVAAGIVPMAGANDGGGSIRIPAAYCGLFGLRPSRGRVPLGPRIGEVWEGASSDHVITRSVRDSAAMLDALQGPDAGAPFHIAPPARPYLQELDSEPGPLRIAYTERSPIGTPVHAECVEAVRDAARLLESLGHHVEQAEPQIDGQALAECYMTMYFGQVAATVAQIRALTGASETEFEDDTRIFALLGRSVSAGDYVQAHSRWNEFARALGRFHAQYDLYLTPTLASPPPRIGELVLPPLEKLAIKPILGLGLGKLLLASGMVPKVAIQNLQHVPFTQLSNLTGTPSMTVPLYWSAENLPLGAHFIAPFGREDLLLKLAAQLERARPWFDRIAQI